MRERTESLSQGASRPDWVKGTAAYQQADNRKAIGQLVNTFLPYLALWAAMVWLVREGYPYWIVLLLSVVAAGLQIRIFIFFHDCCHGSFFASQRANKVVGTICGILTLTPYEDWRHSHAIHHATVGDLDRRGTGDVWTMTVQEYRSAPLWKQIAYRVVRFPPFTFVIGPTLIFVLFHRLPHKGARKKDLISIYATDAAIAGLILLAHWTIGLRALLMVYLPILVISSSVGVWLFYVQHQFEHVYWARHAQWDSMRAAVEGSSHYRLPKVLQWFSGSIGYHHIHHVRARIPNYSLQACQDAIPELQARTTLTFGQSVRCMWLDLWDEDRQQMVGFGALRARKAQPTS